MGKTAFLSVLADNEFPKEHLTTIGIDFRQLSLRKGGDEYRLQLWDTGGQDRFRPIIQAVYQKTSLAFFFYDTTDLKTLEAVFTRFDNFKLYNEQIAQIPCALVGAKCDDELNKKVKTELGAETAEKLGMNFYQISTKDKIGVYELLLTEF